MEKIREILSDGRDFENFNYSDFTFSELLDYVEDFFQYVGLDNEDKIFELILAGDVDFRDEYCDGVIEWADSQVSVYDYDLFKNASKFRDFTQQAILEYGVDAQRVEERGIIPLLQMGEFYFFESIAYQALDIFNNMR